MNFLSFLSSHKKKKLTAIALGTGLMTAGLMRCTQDKTQDVLSQSGKSVVTSATSSSNQKIASKKNSSQSPSKKTVLNQIVFADDEQTQATWEVLRESDLSPSNSEGMSIPTETEWENATSCFSQVSYEERKLFFETLKRDGLNVYIDHPEKAGVLMPFVSSLLKIHESLYRTESGGCLSGTQSSLMGLSEDHTKIQSRLQNLIELSEKKGDHERSAILQEEQMRLAGFFSNTNSAWSTALQQQNFLLKDARNALEKNMTEDPSENNLKWALKQWQHLGEISHTLNTTAQTIHNTTLSPDAKNAATNRANDLLDTLADWHTQREQVAHTEGSSDYGNYFMPETSFDRFRQIASQNEVTE